MELVLNNAIRGADIVRPLFDNRKLWIGAAITAGAGLIGGLFNSSSQKSANAANLQIARENNKFNAEEAQKNRDWQENVYRRYQSLSSQYEQMRANGMNPYLASAQNGAIGSGATASAAENATMVAPRVGDAISSAAQGGVQTYLAEQQQDISQQLADSQTSLNESEEQLKEAQKALTEQSTQESMKRVEEMNEKVQQLRINNNFLQDTYSSRVQQQYTLQSIQNWNEQDAKYSAISKRYDYFNLKPMEVQEVQSRIMLNIAQGYAHYAQGDLSYGELKMLPRKVAALETSAYAALMSAKAQQESVSNQKDYWKNFGKLMGAKFDSQEFQNNLLKLPVGFKPKNMGEAFYKNTFDCATQTFENLTWQPDLIRSMIFKNYVAPTSDVADDLIDGYMESTKETNGGSFEETKHYDKDGNLKGSTTKEKDSGSTSRSKQSKRSNLRKQIRKFRASRLMRPRIVPI